MNNTVQIMDTTLRDGEQTQGVCFTADEKLILAKALLESLQVDRIEVASARVSNGEKQTVCKINQWAKQAGYEKRVEVLGFVDGGKSVDWIYEAGGKVINLLAKGSENHCRQQLGKTCQQHLADIIQTVQYAHSRDMTVNMYLEDWSNGYQDNPRYVFDLLDGLAGVGIDHFMLPDTLGVLAPAEVSCAMADMQNRYRGLLFDFHPHNDYGLATANVLAAVDAGIRNIHCTINCLGERAGNAALDQVTVALRDKMQMQLAIDESHLVRISELVENFSGKPVAANTPIVGLDVFTQTAGIHADGDLKGDLYKSQLFAERFARKHSYALGKMSGKASLTKNLQLLDIELSAENQQKVLARIIQLGDAKQAITTDDLPFIIADVLQSKNYQHLQLLNCTITSDMDAKSSADISLAIAGKTHQGQGFGNGGFDAFINTVGEILAKHDYTLPKLLDFAVRIPKGGNTEALTECVITWGGVRRHRKTRGLHPNQVFAAIFATLRIINIELQEKADRTGK